MKAQFEVGKVYDAQCILDDTQRSIEVLARDRESILYRYTDEQGELPALAEIKTEEDETNGQFEAVFLEDVYAPISIII